MAEHEMYNTESLSLSATNVAQGLYHPQFLLLLFGVNSQHEGLLYYSKTCLKRNATVPVIFFSVFTGFRFTKGSVLIKQSTKNMIA